MPTGKALPSRVGLSEGTRSGESWLTTTLDGTNHDLDLQNPDNLGATSTDNGVVQNLKWSFSNSHERLFKGGWVREQVVTDLPSSPDLSAAQLHLTKGAIREMHWHRVVRQDGGHQMIQLTESRLNGVT